LPFLPHGPAIELQEEEGPVISAQLAIPVSKTKYSSASVVRKSPDSVRRNEMEVSIPLKLHDPPGSDMFAQGITITPSNDRNTE
jgi:hypothetical protein